MEHYEIYRIVNRKKDEYYVFPMETLQGKDFTHLSYHKSGKFHWRIENEAPVVPQDGEADYRNADLISQAVDHLTGGLDGYCLAICPGTPIDSVRTMLKILDGYVIPPLEHLPAGLLLERQNLTLPLPMVSPQKRAVQLVFSDAKAKNEYKENSKEEIEAALRKQIGPDAKVIHLDPTEKTYVALGDKYMMRIFEIAQSIVAPKLGPKGPQFWTK